MQGQFFKCDSFEKNYLRLDTFFTIWHSRPLNSDMGIRGQQKFAEETQEEETAKGVGLLQHSGFSPGRQWVSQQEIIIDVVCVICCCQQEACRHTAFVHARCLSTVPQETINFVKLMTSDLEFLASKRIFPIRASEVLLYLVDLGGIGAIPWPPPMALNLAASSSHEIREFTISFLPLAQWRNITCHFLSWSLDTPLHQWSQPGQPRPILILKSFSFLGVVTPTVWESSSVRHWDLKK